MENIEDAWYKLNLSLDHGHEIPDGSLKFLDKCGIFIAFAYIYGSQFLSLK